MWSVTPPQALGPSEAQALAAQHGVSEGAIQTLADALAQCRQQEFGLHADHARFCATQSQAFVESALCDQRGREQRSDVCLENNSCGSGMTATPAPRLGRGSGTVRKVVNP